MAHCLRHYEEPIAALCRNCNQPFCTRCLVFAFGPKKPPYCVGCALTASGVRAGRGPTPVKADPDTVAPQDKRVARAQKRADKAARTAVKPSRFGRKSAPEPVVDDAPGHEPRPTYVPAPSSLKSQTAHQV